MSSPLRSKKRLRDEADPETDVSLERQDWKETLRSVVPSTSALVLTDPPYGTTRNAWDKIPFTFEEYYAEVYGCLRPNGAVVTFSAEPFTSNLVLAPGSHFKYCWHWNKRLGTNFLNAKKQPLRTMETLVVGYRKQCLYNPQMTAEQPGKKARSWKRRNTATGSYRPYGEATYDSSAGKYPTTLLSFYNPPKGKTHPTEKPVDLCEYLIKTYTDPGDLVVDPFCGTGAVAVACRNTGRSFCGGDTSEEFLEVARARLAST